MVRPRLLTTVVLLLGLTLPAAQPLLTSGAASAEPNFVVILLDDLDVASVSEMPAVKRRLTDEGATFDRFFATTPLCCPSRASILTGQYAHNHRVLRNTGDDAGFAAFLDSGHESNTLATMLDGAGYETALIGKYLNGYSFGGEGQSYVPPGWDYWVAGIDHGPYGGFNYDLNVNGETIRYGRHDQDYVTDVLADYALEFLDQAAGAGDPFFLYLAPYAPHAPSTPAPRHKGTFRGAKAPRTPAFNERNIRDKPDWIRGTSRLSDDRVARIDENHQQRLESLQAVDEMVDAVMQRLDRGGTLGSTYVLFLSDNGYFLGEHRQPHGKDAPYDAASRVPAIVRGPGIAPGTTVSELVLNIDLLPTLAELAGLGTPSSVDGRSLVPLLKGSAGTWREVALIEGFGKEKEALEGSETATPAFRALRAENALYVEYETGERELYDLRKDPYQTSNMVRESPKSLLRDYSHRLETLTRCRGQDCGSLENQSLGEDASPVPSGGFDNLSGHRASRSKGDRARRNRSDGTGSTDRRFQIGGIEEQAQALRLKVPREASGARRLQLRVHIASVSAQGTLVAAVDPAAAGNRNGGAGARERLGGASVNSKGWVAIDVTEAFGDSGAMTVVLRGRDGADIVVSSPKSGNPPELVSDNGSGKVDGKKRQSAREHRRDDGPGKRKQRDKRDRGRAHRGR